MTLPPAAWPEPEGVLASAACWERYGELSARTVSLRDPAFIHQHAVDAYAAQHVGPSSRPMGTLFALAGLYLACEHGLSGRAVQRAHTAMAQRKREWPVFPPPRDPGPVTVVDALAAPGELPAALLGWATSVWSSWKGSQPAVRAWVATCLEGDLQRFGRGR